MTEYVSGYNRLELMLNGDLVSVKRRDLGLTQRDLAARSRVSLATIGRIEQRARSGCPVTRRVWRQIAKALGLKRDSEMFEILIRVVDEDGDPVSLQRQRDEELYSELHS